MFVFTAKFNRRRAVAIVLALAVLLCAIILLAGRGSDAAEAGAFDAVVKNNEQRVAFLSSLGWEVESEPLDEQSVIIPREFDDVYAVYNELQLSQGFDLSKYGGREATRYTYSVKNYPDTSGSVVADLIVYRNRIIAGDIQSTSLGGFMRGLEYPEAEPGHGS